MYPRTLLPPERTGRPRRRSQVGNARLDRGWRWPEGTALWRYAGAARSKSLVLSLPSHPSLEGPRKKGVGPLPMPSLWALAEGRNPQAPARLVRQSDRDGGGSAPTGSQNKKPAFKDHADP